jgi:hypothetical protein
MTMLLWIRPIFGALLLALAGACWWSAYRDRGAKPAQAEGRSAKHEAA